MKTLQAVKIVLWDAGFIFSTDAVHIALLWLWFLRLFKRAVFSRGGNETGFCIDLSAWANRIMGCIRFDLWPLDVEKVQFFVDVCVECSTRTWYENGRDATVVAVIGLAQKVRWTSALTVFMDLFKTTQGDGIATSLECTLVLMRILSLSI